MSNGLDLMKKRLGYLGYDAADGRIVGGKYRSFKDALRLSYQAEWITINKGTDKEQRWRCLINPSRLTDNFDKKVISIDFDAGVREGTVFWWDRTEKYWMVSLQQHTEEAYFRGMISRADYEIDIDGDTYWAVARGPVETSTVWNLKHQIAWNDLNYSIVLQIAKDDKTVHFFTRHQIVKLRLSYPDAETGEEKEEFHNWRVVATDKYSSDNVIDVYLDEYNDNEMEDQKVDPTPPQPDVEQPYIEGSRMVYGYDSELFYSIVGYTSGTWSVNNKNVKIVACTANSCELEILSGKAFNFILTFTNEDGAKIEQEIVVRSF